MNSAYNRFIKNLESVKSIDNIYNYLLNFNVDSIDLTELLRAGYVLIVSAFDGLVHDFVRTGLLIIFNDEECTDKSLSNFQISLQTVKEIVTNESSTERLQLLDNEIRKLTSKDSYQSPHSIECALQLICVKKIWTKIGAKTDKRPDDLRKQLGLIINRRNKIAHEADYNIITGEKDSLSKDDLDEVFSFIKLLSKSLFEIVTEEITHANTQYT